MSRREVVLDTETTGFRPEEGHRLVEIGCIELLNHVPTGKVFHTYCNPERDMPMGAFEVHGISAEFLRDKPLFSAVAEGFLAFIGDDPLVIHNSAFDMGFINFELERVGRPALPMARAIDTVTMARAKFPGQPASLDALCRRFSVDLSVRDKHGALTDAKLLAEVYLGLIGGRQQGLTLAGGDDGNSTETLAAPVSGNGPSRPARPHAPSEEELKAHAAFVGKLKEPVWAS